MLLVLTALTLSVVALPAWMWAVAVAAFAVAVALRVTDWAATTSSRDPGALGLAPASWSLIASSERARKPPETASRLTPIPYAPLEIRRGQPVDVGGLISCGASATR